MSTDIGFQQQMAQLHASYGAMYDKAQTQLRKRPVLAAALYLKDALRMGVSSLGGAALCVPLAWFWGAVSDMGSIQKAMVAPVDSAAVWASAGTLFTVLFSMQLGWLILRGNFGRSYDARIHADAQLLFTQEVARHAALKAEAMRNCPHCSDDTVTH
jgi:hypothetical protein